MPDSAPRLCSWDSTHVPPGSYTTANAAEVLPGITPPLSADLWREWDYAWTHGVLEDLEVLDLVDLPKPPGSTMMPFIGGRFVLNIGLNMAYTATFSVGEGSDLLKQFVGDEGEVTSGAAGDQERAAATRERVIERWERSEAVYAKNREITSEAYRRSRTRDWQAASDSDLFAALDEAVQLAGRSVIPHYYNSMGGAEYTTIVGNILQEHIPDHPPEWMNTITSGLTGVESALAAKAIWDLSRFIAARPALATEFASLTAADLTARLDEPPSEDWRAFATEYASFIDGFGFRGQNETDPFYPTWDEAPNFVLSSLQADLNAGPERNPHELERQQAAARTTVEREIESRLTGDVVNEYGHNLRLAQALNRDREGTKACWARACRTERPPVVELGRRLAERGVINDAEDVWFLRLNEVREGVAGTLDRDGANASIASRKEERAFLAAHELPVMFDWPVELIPKEAAEAVTSATFEGQGISPGSATGKARVIESAAAVMSAAIEPGEILIAPVTDAAWTPLFVPAAGVVVETGGVLSHAATVAREFGIPAVAGIPGVTSRIPNAATVTVDGSTGTVTVEP